MSDQSANHFFDSDGYQCSSRDMQFLVDYDENSDQTAGPGNEHRFQFYADDPTTGTLMLEAELVTDTMTLHSAATTRQLGDAARPWTSATITTLTTGITDTQVVFSNDGVLTGAAEFVFDGTTLFLHATHRLVVGHDAEVSFGATPAVQIHGTAGDASMGFARWSANAGGATLRFLKSRSGTIGTNTIVQDGDELGRIRFQAADGGDFNTNAAEISAEVDGTPGLNDMPGRILFSTTSDGASSVTERMRIDSAGLVTLAADITGVNAVFTGYYRGGGVTNANAAGDGSWGTGSSNLLFFDASVPRVYVGGVTGSRVQVDTSSGGRIELFDGSADVIALDSGNNRIRLEDTGGNALHWTGTSTTRLWSFDGSSSSTLSFKFENSGSGTFNVTLAEGNLTLTDGNLDVDTAGKGFNFKANTGSPVDWVFAGDAGSRDVILSVSTSVNPAFSIENSSSGGARLKVQTSINVGTTGLGAAQQGDAAFGIALSGQWHFDESDAASHWYNSSGTKTHTISADAETVFNTAGADLDHRFEGDSMTHMLFLEGNAASENIALLAAGLPNWQSMDRGLFIGDVTTAPTVTATSGAFLWSAAGVVTIGSDGQNLAYDDANATLTSTSESAGATGPVFTLYQNSASPATNDVIGRFTFDGQNSTPAQITYTRIDGVIASTTAASENAELHFKVMSGGSFVDPLRLELDNVSLFAGAGSYGGGIGVQFVGDVTTAPTSDPVAGGLLYSLVGAGTWRGSSGTITTFGPSEPHCERCGRDFATEHRNEKYGCLSICLWCLTKALDDIGVPASRYVICRIAA